jgi:hypothetical protein
MFYPIGCDRGIERNHLVQHRAQLWDIPLTIAQVKDSTVQRRARVGEEHIVKSVIGTMDK